MGKMDVGKNREFKRYGDLQRKRVIPGLSGQEDEPSEKREKGPRKP